MTVTTTLDREYFPGDGFNKNFPFDFKFLDNTHIYVYLIDAEGTATGKTLNVDYTISGVNNPGGGMVVMSQAPAVGSRLLIQRVLPQTQQTSIRNQGAFFPNIHEDVFDRLTMLIQQSISSTSNALQLDKSGDRWDFRGLPGSNAADPVRPQDVATKNWSEQYIGSLIEQSQGNMNLAQNVLYVGPDGITRNLQNLSSMDDPALGSRLIAWLGTDIGVVARTVADKLGDYLHVKDFGMTGVGDETAKFQACLNAANGRWIHGDGGITYTIRTSLINSGQRLRSISLMTAAGTEDFRAPITIDGRVTKKTNIVFDRVTVNGNRVNQTMINSSAGEDGGRHCMRILGNVEGVSCTGCATIFAAGHGVSFFGVTPSASDLEYKFSNIYFRDHVSEWNRGHGLAADGCVDFSITGGRFNYNGRDLDTTSPQTSGARGMRSDLNALFGRGITFEDYGIGYAYRVITLDDVVSFGNIGGILFQSALTTADLASGNYLVRGSIKINNVKVSMLAGPGIESPAISFFCNDATFAHSAFADITCTNCDLQGHIALKGVDNFNFSGRALAAGGEGFVCTSTQSKHVRIDAELLGTASIVYDVPPVSFTGSASAGSSVSGITTVITSTYPVLTARISATCTTNGAGIQQFVFTAPAGTKLRHIASQEVIPSTGGPILAASAVSDPNLVNVFTQRADVVTFTTMIDVQVLP